MFMDRRTSLIVLPGQTVLVLLAFLVDLKIACGTPAGVWYNSAEHCQAAPDLTGRPSPTLRPVIQNLSARLYGGYLVITGNLVQVVGDPTQWTVLLSGSIVGNAAVRPDGTFTYTTDYGYAYGDVSARAVGPNGMESARATTEIHP